MLLSSVMHCVFWRIQFERRIIDFGIPHGRVLGVCLIMCINTKFGIDISGKDGGTEFLHLGSYGGIHFEKCQILGYHLVKQFVYQFTISIMLRGGVPKIMHDMNGNPDDSGNGSLYLLYDVVGNIEIPAFANQLLSERVKQIRKRAVTLPECSI